jgi:hypothetical protein
MQDIWCQPDFVLILTWLFRACRHYRMPVPLHLLEGLKLQ